MWAEVPAQGLASWKATPCTPSSRASAGVAPGAGLGWRVGTVDTAQGWLGPACAERARPKLLCTRPLPCPVAQAVSMTLKACHL